MDCCLAKNKYNVISEKFLFQAYHTYCKKQGRIHYVIDSIVNEFLPNRNEQPELYELVKSYQLHRHSCWKYKNQLCRFNFERLFSKESTVAESLPVDMLKVEENLTLQKN